MRKIARPPLPGKPTSYTFEMTEHECTALDEDYGGLCIRCGEESYGVEPDARAYACESCGARAVYGIQELTLAGRIAFIEATA